MQTNCTTHRNWQGPGGFCRNDSAGDGKCVLAGPAQAWAWSLIFPYNFKTAFCQGQGCLGPHGYPDSAGQLSTNGSLVRTWLTGKSNAAFLCLTQWVRRRNQKLCFFFLNPSSSCCSLSYRVVVIVKGSLCFSFPEGFVPCWDVTRGKYLAMGAAHGPILNSQWVWWSLHTALFSRQAHINSWSSAAGLMSFVLQQVNMLRFFCRLL